MEGKRQNDKGGEREREREKQRERETYEIAAKRKRGIVLAEKARKLLT